MWRTKYPDLAIAVDKALAELLKKSDVGFNGYAITYLKGMDEAYRQYGEGGIKPQLNYALSNMGSWHGEVARECKKVFKDFR